jgi:hypothetical protein
MDIDPKYEEAVKEMEDIGFKWDGSRWTYPHVDDLSPQRRLSVIDVGDLMYELLRKIQLAAGINAARIDGLAETWEIETGYIHRHIRPSEGPPPKFKIVRGPTE